jgi:hypothetical protein
MNILYMKEKTEILRALVEGCSIRSVERLTGHIWTIEEILTFSQYEKVENSN